MPTGSPQARLPLGQNVPQSPGLGHTFAFANKQPGPGAFGLVPRRSLTEAEGGGRCPARSRAPGVDVEVEVRRRQEALGLVLPVPALPTPSQHQGTRVGAGGCPLATASRRSISLQPHPVAFEKLDGGGGPRGEGGRPWGGPKSDNMTVDSGAPQVQARPAAELWPSLSCISPAKRGEGQLPGKVSG